MKKRFPNEMKMRFGEIMENDLKSKVTKYDESEKILKILEEKL